MEHKNNWFAHFGGENQPRSVSWDWIALGSVGALEGRHGGRKVVIRTDRLV